MEVHTHTHTERKKLKHYLWEFLMLFLAVFCGFLAENIREHRVEHQREKEYMQSMMEDIKQDIQLLDTAIEKNLLQIRGKDSIILLLQNGTITAQQTKLFYDLQWKYVGLEYPIIFSKRTLAQLLNAGGLRLIRNKKVSDAITEYANSIDHLEKLNIPSNIAFGDYALLAAKRLIDVRFSRALPDENFTLAPYENPILRSTNSDTLKDFAFMLEMDKENTIYFVRGLKKHLQLTSELLHLLEKEYHLK